ncbi:MAG: helix-turn-helix domain-containing protein [Burkholderiales bacterium]|jgi:lambda repressor-like predicted transcriptional regulator|nr:helix-turn-helix domain-containing protein [Burkholderiales bacterium]
MHPDLIAAQLRIRGQSSAHIAARLGVSRALVSYVIHGHRHNRRVRSAIARALGMKVAQVWPDKTCDASQIENPKSLIRKVAALRKPATVAD